MNQKLKLALVGPSSAPKLFSALQLAYGMAGKWQRVAVIGDSPEDTLYRHLGEYTTLTLSKDASPSRYAELLALCAESCKEVAIFSSFSEEWQSGVDPYTNTVHYEDLLRSHRKLLQAMRNTPVHVITLINTRRVFLLKDNDGRCRLRFREVLQQQSGIEGEFQTVLHLDKKGEAKVEKDETDVFDRERRARLNVHHGAILSDWCGSEESPQAIQTRELIDRCATIEELHKLLFELDLSEESARSAFVRRRTELDLEYDKNRLQALPGGRL